METILEISLWGKKVGVLAWDRTSETGIFEFYDSFPSLELDIAPLTMPLDSLKRGERIHSFPENQGKTFKGLPGLIADSLPDDYGNSLIDEYFASKGLSAWELTPVDRLCYVGKRALGALEFEPSMENRLLNRSSVIEIEHLAALADEILNRREKFQAALKSNDQSVRDILSVGTSAGGARPKAIIAWNEKTNEVRSGQVKAPAQFSYWIIKFDGVEDKKLKDNPLGVGRIEYAYYLMAKDCGINMAESRLFPDGKHSHFVTKRFDRLDDGSRLHIQTLCAMAHLDRDKRHSYEQGFQVMRRLNLPENSLQQFFRRMVFNIVARNHDDHTKNHSFVMSMEGEWDLAPAYDITFSYDPSGRWTGEHQLSANNKRDNFEISDLLAVGRNMGIRSAEEIIEQVLDVVSGWNKYSEEAGVLKEHSKQISRSLRLMPPDFH